MIIAALAAAIVVAFFIFLAAGSSEEDDSDVVYETAAAKTTHMVRTLTAAGKVTTGEKENISLVKGKTLKAVCVTKNEAVKGGYPLAYYTDGTHTDAPVDGIVTGIRAPENGETVTDSDSISFNDTQELYLKVTVPEDEINNINMGDTAQIVINAKPKEKFFGEIVEKKDVSTTMINEIRSDKQENKSSEEDEDEDIDDEDSAEDEDEEDDVDLDEEEEPVDEEGDGNGTVYYSVNIRFSNDGTIRPGMSASCIITVSNRDDVLTVPIEAVYFDDRGKSFVYKTDGKKDKEKTYVKLGSSDAVNVEIESGLKQGDKIKYDKH